MPIKAKIVKVRRIVEFLLLFFVTLFIKRFVYSDLYALGSTLTTIVRVGALVAILLTIVFVVIEARSDFSIDTGKAILEHQFKSTEEMKSMPSNFWYSRAITNKSNTLISPELIAGCGTALVSGSIIISVIIALLFWTVDLFLRFTIGEKKKKLISNLGKEGKAITELAWNGKKYKGMVEVEGVQLQVKIDKNSDAIAIGDMIQLLNLDGMEYIVRKVQQ